MSESRPFLGPSYAAALEYATIAHAAQVRKDTETPYITHLVAVAELVLRDGGTETEAIAALLHDAVEDQGGRRRLDDIEQRFGVRVAQIVAGCSEWIEERHQSSTDKPSWCDRKRASLEHIATETDASILRVSLADKLHNATAIANDLRAQGLGMMARFNAGPIDLLWYYRGLVEAFRLRGSPAMHLELASAVREIERLLGSVPRRRHVVGVDGARAGWVAVTLGDDCSAAVRVFTAFSRLLAEYADAEVVAVDMPIGLEPEARRVADLAAKGYLGRNGARVFMTPPRDALALATHQEALAMLRSAGRPLISAQAFALGPKILEVDAAVASDDRVREVHPEVSFRAMNGDSDLRDRKKTPAGLAERRGLINKSGVWSPEDASELPRVAPDDVLDAGAAAWSALRLANGMGKSLPEEPRLNERGRPVAIWY